MNSHPFTVLPLANGSRFVFTPCPGTQGSDLLQSIQSLRDADCSAVITVLTNDEIKSLKVPDLSQQVISSGLQWFQLPIEDDTSPKDQFLERFHTIKSTLLSLLATQKTIAIHCSGGSGRTGLMAAILLLEYGIGWADVKSLIQSVRPKALTLPVHTEFLITHYKSRGHDDN